MDELQTTRAAIMSTISVQLLLAGSTGVQGIAWLSREEE